MFSVVNPRCSLMAGYLDEFGRSTHLRMATIVQRVGHQLGVRRQLGKPMV